MYIPSANVPPSEDDVRRLLLATRAGDLVTLGDDGLTVSMIPLHQVVQPAAAVVLERDRGSHTLAT